jgi:DegV family protein with EDD domain
MSQSIVVMTDSTAGLPIETIEALGLLVVPCQVFVGDEVYKEGVDLTAQELFERIFTSQATPTTSLPTGDDYRATFQAAVDRGATQLLGVFVGSGLSGTFNGARIAAQEFPQLETYLVDSGTVSAGLALLVKEAVRLVNEGGDLQTIGQRLDVLAEKSELYALLDTLEYIRRGGRIGRVGELIANVLNIKPVLRLARNSGDVVARNRSRKKGIAWLNETAAKAQNVRGLNVIHINAEADALELAESLRPLLPPGTDIAVGPAPAAVAAHGGPGAVGFGILTE